MQRDDVFFQIADDPEKLLGRTPEELYLNTKHNTDLGCFGLLMAVYDLLRYEQDEKAKRLLVLGANDPDYFFWMSWYAAQMIDFVLTEKRRPKKEIDEFLKLINEHNVVLTVLEV